ncbi:MAG: RHS repeat-associated core domain-containing protein [Paracoccaceae bacterium]
MHCRAEGQWFQSESGLHQNWMRDYDPTTGRYIQADPLGLVDGASVYGYARQNPGRYVDPRGEEANQLGPAQTSFHDRFLRCVAANDPLTGREKLALLGIGGPIPKKLVRLPRGLKGASPFTTLPSIAAHKATGGKANLSKGGRAARNFGRLGYVGVIGYGWYMLGIEARCACSSWE